MSEQRPDLQHPAHGGNRVWAAQIAGCPPSCILDFSANINPLGPPVGAIAAIQNSLNELRAYPTPGYAALRQALGEFHQIDPDWILPGNGAAELLTWAGRDFASLDAVALMTPGFGDYDRALTGAGAAQFACPLDMDALLTQGWDFDTTPLQSFPIDPRLAAPQLQSRVQSASAQPFSAPTTESLGVLINNPHNPTGVLWSASGLVPLVEALADRPSLVVIDEAFMDFLPPSQQQSLVEWVVRYPHLVILRSLTKFYSLPGLRIGYAIAHPDRLRCWQRWRDPWPVNVLAEAAAIASLQDTTFQQQTWNWLAVERSHLIQGLSAIGGLSPYPGAANYLLVRTEASATDLQCRLLQHHRILIRDCLSFPELGDRYFRVAVRTRSDNETLLSALAQLCSSSSP